MASNKSNKGENQMYDIRKHRFMANISTTSKVFLDKKHKSKSRRKLNKNLANELRSID
jgi:hypothetical protein